MGLPLPRDGTRLRRNQPPFLFISPCVTRTSPDLRCYAQVENQPHNNKVDIWATGTSSSKLLFLQRLDGCCLCCKDAVVLSRVAATRSVAFSSFPEVSLLDSRSPCRRSPLRDADRQSSVFRTKTPGRKMQHQRSLARSRARGARARTRGRTLLLLSSGTFPLRTCGVLYIPAGLLQPSQAQRRPQIAFARWICRLAAFWGPQRAECPPAKVLGRCLATCHHWPLT